MQCAAFIAPYRFYFIHSDHLDSPRSITNTAGKEVWRWDNTDPFGNNIANENPANQGTFTFNLRFPGQYFDRETGLHYNVNRDYNPAIGRYVESDPIGLRGGINTFGYVGGNPLSRIDLLGLIATLSDEECAQLEKDIGLEKDTIQKLRKMMLEGKNFEHYGLVPHADSSGYVNGALSAKSQTYQNLVRELESDTARADREKWQRLKIMIIVGWNKASAAVENARSESVLKDMEKIFNAQCKECKKCK
ncbi:MAG: hypothetical protein PHU06_13155 [Gallionella sp.]|nr:hypothetical protein [Gallionella sp.]MDD4959633.1 hypothetical protein [Gallionella sp.]